MVEHVRFATVGGNQFIADELLAVTRQIIGENAVGIALPFDRVAGTTADLYVCGATLKADLGKKVPPANIVGLDLVPTTDYFVKVAALPAGSTVVLFNNNSRYAKLVVSLCRELEISQADFVCLGYNEMSVAEIAATLREARYVAGIKALVEGVLLAGEFKECLRPDCQVIPITRMATMESANELIRWLTRYEHRLISSRVIDTIGELLAQVEEMKSMTDSVVGKIDDNAESIAKLHQTIDESVELLQRLGSVSSDVSEAAKGISLIADTIQRISSQTKLLALNASIEAARAGSHGRGFAVVASEVGKLADESGQSTSLIRQAVSGVFKAVDEIAPALTKLETAIINNQEHFRWFAQSSREQIASLTEIFAAIDTINRKSEELTATAKQMTH